MVRAVSEPYGVELLLNMRSLLLLSLIHLAATNSTLRRKAVCVETDDMPVEWYENHDFTPSALSDLDLQLNLQKESSASSLNISWSINIDSSIHSIKGTWIVVETESHIQTGTVSYRCDYQPPFTSKPDNYSGLEKLWFSFTTVTIVPLGFYTVYANNLPSPTVDVSETHIKIKEVQAPGCDDEHMRTHSACSYKSLDLNVGPLGDEVVISFTSSSEPEEYDILLQRNQNKLNRTVVKTNGKDSISLRMNYSAPCENLTVSMKPRSCSLLCKWVNRDVDCTKLITETERQVKEDNSTLLINIGCAVAIAVLLILICFCQLCNLWRRSSSTGSVQVLVVYPAVDSKFQHAVMAVAEFLRSHKGLNVVIDMWQRSTLAEQGPLRWLNLQADKADNVLIVLPPQHSNISISANTEQVSSSIRDYTVPASAQELFSLALNLVASSAHDPKLHHKFWVVCLGQGGKQNTVPVELRGCKTLSLPKDLEKVHQKLTSRQGEKCSSLRCRMWSFHWRKTSKKVREALLQLERSHPNGLKEEMVRLTEVESRF